jgi:drug/metabolite transporter (DMT)-like permease
MRPIVAPAFRGRTPVTESRLDIPALACPPDLDVPRTDRRAALGLVLATVLWGCGFTWAKAAGEGVHRRMELPDGSLFGPIFILAWRFLIAGVALFLAVPAARRGWTGGGAARGAGVGMALAAGLIVQHLGLDRTSEAVSAFLTSLTILFVPLLTLVLFRTSPSPLLWAGVAVATAGIWLMTGATPAGFGSGELLGLACAACFAVYILAVNASARTETAWRLTAAQFVVTSAVCFAACLIVPGGGPRALSPGAMWGVLSRDGVWLNVLLLSAFPTFGAFVLLNVCQPRLDATRAALIYLFEPVVAAAYAWAAAGRKLGVEALVGAGLILTANVLVEVLSARAKRKVA